MDFPSLGNSDHIVVSVSIKLKTTCLFSLHSRVDWDGLRDPLRDVLWKDIFKLNAPATASEFCEWVQIGLMYISLIVSIRPNRIHLHGFQQLLLLPQFIEITFFIFFLLNLKSR